jgi:hypothetical protein
MSLDVADTAVRIFELALNQHVGPVVVFCPVVETQLIEVAIFAGERALKFYPHPLTAGLFGDLV